MADAPRRELSEVAPVEVDLELLRAACPGWHIARVSGTWHAFRGGVFMLDGPWSLLRCHLHADTLLALAEQLGLQEHLDSLSEPELAEVWRLAQLPKRSGQTAS